MVSKQTEQQKIGYLIKELRLARNMTQAEFAKELGTSQSAVARMEAGKQNFSTKELTKISQALEHPLISVSQNATDDFEIEGGHQLSGTITTNTSKNGALGLFCASLLNKGTTTLHGIPRIQEIMRMIEVFESIDISVKWIDEHSVRIQPPKKFDLTTLNRASARRMRSIIMLIGPLIHHVKEFSLPYSGGCQMGRRTIAAHRYGLEQLGVSIDTARGSHSISRTRLKPTEITMYERSDTGTENLLMAAALIPGTTTIHFAQQNYMVQDVMLFLSRLGVKIEVTGPGSIQVTGVKTINTDIEHHNSEDPIESMAFLSAGIVTKSKLTIARCPIEFLRLELFTLKLMGLEYKTSKEYLSHNKHTKLVDITVLPSTLHAPPEKIHPLPYPGINVDNLPFFVPIATQAKGSTLINDWMWENRAIYFTEINRLHADIVLADPHRVIVNGPSKLHSAQIVCPPALRPSMIIMIAMLAAPGTSVLRNVYAIKRGYENIAERLNAIGAKVKVIKSF